MKLRKEFKEKILLGCPNCKFTWMAYAETDNIKCPMCKKTFDNGEHETA